MKILVCLQFSVLLAFAVFGQDKAYVKFGMVLPQDFIVAGSHVVDSNSNAVILDDVGSTNFIGNKYHWFSYVYKKSIRIKIINERASDLSTVRIHLYGSKNRKDQLSDLKAVTYNLENGKVVSTALNPGDVFEDKLSSYATLTKFSLPAVKAGSIIEYSYTITSYHCYSLPPWFFQHIGYSCLYSEYKVVFPNALRYLTVRYGLDSLSVNKTAEVKNNHYTMGDLSVTSNDMMSFWAMKDIPAFTEENFIDSPVDYLDKIEFFLAQAYNGEDVEDVGATWESVTNQLLTEENFGAAIEKDNSANLLNTAEKVTSGDENRSQSARSLYYYVRDNFICVPDDEIKIGNTLYDVNKKRKGNVAEINLLLTALLRQKGFQADPVILSTREYGKNPPGYPILDRMNYVICMAMLGLDTFYLDASRPELGFGKLSIDCYNGHARIISKSGTSVYFSLEKITEQRNTTAIIYNEKKGELGGSVETSYGFFGSENLRKEIRKSGQKKFVDHLKSSLTTETDILNFGIDSLSRPDYPITTHFQFHAPASSDIIYFDPVILAEYGKNPFEVEERKYPVTLDYPIDNLYVLNMEIPEGYAVDELPRSAKVAFNGDEGFFEYMIQQDQSRIQLRSHLKLNETVFPSEDYNSLRDFFAFVLKKCNEQIVFKRKK